MKISRVLMCLGVAFTLGFAIVGCDSTEPTELGKIAAPIDGEPRAGANGELDVDGSIYGPDGKLKNRRIGSNADDGGKPSIWEPGTSNLSKKSGEFKPVPIPGLSFEPIYFEYDRSDLRPSEMSKLQKVAEFLRSRPELGLIIEGHCDDRGSEEYNRALGERRAISLRNQLVKLGVNDEHMKTMSYGKDRPAVQGVSAEARAKNRRGETIPAQIQ